MIRIWIVFACVCVCLYVSLTISVCMCLCIYGRCVGISLLALLSLNIFNWICGCVYRWKWVKMEKLFSTNFLYMEKTEWLALWSFKLLSFRCKKNEKCMPFWIRSYVWFGSCMSNFFFFLFHFSVYKFFFSFCHVYRFACDTILLSWSSIAGKSLAPK